MCRQRLIAMACLALGFTATAPPAVAGWLTGSSFTVEGTNAPTHSASR